MPLIINSPFSLPPTSTGFVMFAGGSTDTSVSGGTVRALVDQYEYATDVRVASTSLLGTRGQAAAGSTTHGGL